MLRTENEVELVADCADGQQAINAIRTTQADLVFLDVQMPEMDGFEVLRQVQSCKLPSIVFVTAFDQYAIKAFEVHALDYLLKPFDRERFLAVFRRARAEIESRQGTGRNQELLERFAESNASVPYADRVAVKHRGRIILLRVAEIVWIEAEENYLRLHPPGASYLLRETMARFETRLDAKRFLRVHRSAIVQVDKLQEIEPAFHGEYTLRLADGVTLTLSRTYRDKFFEHFGHPR